MDKTPEEKYREELKKRLTEKPESDTPTYYSRVGFRKASNNERKTIHPPVSRPRRRIGLVMLLPILLIFMMSGRLWTVVLPLILAAMLYILIKRKR